MRYTFFLFLAIIFLSGFTHFTSVIEVKKIEADVDYLVDLYKSIHQSPELSLQEKETSKKLADELRKVGFEVTENFGGYGIVGMLKNGKGPTILYRTDMDALPMYEKTGLPYASKVEVPYNGGTVGNDAFLWTRYSHDELGGYRQVHVSNQRSVARDAHVRWSAGRRNRCRGESDVGSRSL